MKQYYFWWCFILVLVVCFLCLETTVLGQCPMCKAAAESNLKEGGKHALGLNAGILYLLAAPYLIVVCIGYWWWRNYKQTEPSE